MPETGKIVVVGGCQSVGLVNCLALMATDHSVSRRVYNDKYDDLGSNDYILLQDVYSELKSSLPSQATVIEWPVITFSGFHPDLTFVYSGTNRIDRPLGDYHSSIAFHAWRMGLTATETVSLFRDETYVALGYPDTFETEVLELRRRLAQFSFSPSLVDRWISTGCFMHASNHPKLHVISDIAGDMLHRMNIQPLIDSPEQYLLDNLMTAPIWPVYPELAKRIGQIVGNYHFKTRQSDHPGVAAPIWNLDKFVRRSFDVYQDSHAPLTTARDAPIVENILKGILHAGSSKSAHSTASGSDPRSFRNPYKDAPDHQFWRRAVAGVASQDVDPVVSAKFPINSSMKIATAGSCFAQHIARAVKASGFNYFQTEIAPADMNSQDAERLSYGVFSARYGNIYTARQMLQTFDRAFGRIGSAHPWRRADGKWVDPYRPTIDPEGWDTPDQVVGAREAHLSAVRALFEQMDILVFTLGLTECWHSLTTGDVVPIAPGITAQPDSDEPFVFKNFSAPEVEADLQCLLANIRDVNPSFKVILTVSPVPLMATYENQHVLTATTYSKAALRVAADSVARSNPNVDYMPSYEIITGNFNRGSYFDSDLRSVRKEGVDHVMRLFLRHYCNDPLPSQSKFKQDVVVSRPSSAEFQAVICDEELLDSVTEVQ